MAYITVPNAFTNGSTSDGPAVTANFTALTDGLSDGTKDLYVNDITGEDLTVSGNAGITGNLSITGTSTFTGAMLASGAVTVAGTFTVSGAVAMAQLIPAGTVMLFYQAAAPTGWTRSAAINDKFVRIVSSTTGGVTAGTFTTLSVAAYTGNSGAEASHTHGEGTLYACIGIGSGSGWLRWKQISVTSYTATHHHNDTDVADTEASTNGTDVLGDTSAGTSHLHTINHTHSSAIAHGSSTHAYADCLIATKD